MSTTVDMLRSDGLKAIDWLSRCEGFGDASAKELIRLLHEMENHQTGLDDICTGTIPEITPECIIDVMPAAEPYLYVKGGRLLLDVDEYVGAKAQAGQGKGDDPWIAVSDDTMLVINANLSRIKSVFLYPSIPQLLYDLLLVGFWCELKDVDRSSIIEVTDEVYGKRDLSEFTAALVPGIVKDYIGHALDSDDLHGKIEEEAYLVYWPILKEQHPFNYSLNADILAERAIRRLVALAMIDLDGKARAAITDAVKPKVAKKEPFSSRVKRVSAK